ncbi:hypothetical protein F5888DRAFT_1716384 [Russula emetica]|nr:hypothetical protein F5888DRAFT_1716384 [Russula emetica]
MCISISISTCTCTCAFTRSRHLLRIPTRSRDNLLPPLPPLLRYHLTYALQIVLYGIKIRRKARKWRRCSELLSSPCTSGVRCKEATDTYESAKWVLRDVRGRGLELMRGRCEGEGRRRAFRGAALCHHGVARRERDHDAGLEKRDVTPGAAA